MRDSHRWHNRLLLAAAWRLWRTRTSRPVAAREISRLLVVRVDERLGNILGLQPLLDVVRARLPECRLGLLASARKAEVAASLQGLDDIHLLDKRWFYRSPRRWRRVIEQVRRAEYQVAIDAGAWHEFSFTHAALTYYSGAPQLVGYRRPGLNVRVPYTHPVDPGPADEYEVAQRLRLLQPLGIEATAIPRLRSGLGAEHRQRFQTWLQQQECPGPWVGLWIGARKPERRWPLEQWAELARALAADGAALVVLWGPGERQLAEQLLGRLAQRAVLAPETNVAELAGLLRCLQLTVSNDTGPMHLSVAVGCPTVAVFASGTPGRWGHPGPDVENLACPGEDRRRELAQVLAACRRLLHSGHKTSAPR